MERDTEKTPVLFRADRFGVYRGIVTAVFPTLSGTNEFHTCTCYARIGQHSSCTFDWYRSTRPATPAEYADLQRELESIGYTLEIRQRWTRAMDDARRAELNGGQR